ncbi:MAG: hypothetical protein N5P05_000440 [Chroococcopsis gigantea SAG 12.99]|jgi:FtsZ-binding cell division protein ZapB|nr:hypothetical protein [Chroococcopsis gigantea SAG 12.99]
MYNEMAELSYRIEDVFARLETKINNRLDKLESKVEALQSDVSELKTDVKVLNMELNNIKTNVGEIKGGNNGGELYGRSAERPSVQKHGRIRTLIVFTYMNNSYLSLKYQRRNLLYR